MLAGQREVVLPVETTFEALLRQEDTDGDGLITVDDKGPKVTLSVIPGIFVHRFLTV